MIYGWYKDSDGKYSFFNTKHDRTFGKRLVGWHWIDGYRYYFGNDGVLYQNTTTPDGSQVDKDGRYMKNSIIQHVGGKGLSLKPHMSEQTKKNFLQNQTQQAKGDNKAKKERERDRRIIDSFNFAIEGLTAAIRNEKHMKVHILAAIIIVILAIVINASKVEILIISLSVSFVIITELINTAVEALVDLISPERHPLAKLAKDVAAGAVLVAAINAICVGYLLFYDKLLDIFDGKNKLHVIAGRKGNIADIVKSLRKRLLQSMQKVN